MDENLESVITPGDFSVACSAILADCEPLLDSSGELSGVLFNCQNSGNLQSNGEEVSFDINDILLDFTTSTEAIEEALEEGLNQNLSPISSLLDGIETESQLDTGLVCSSGVSVSEQCFEENLTDTDQQLTLLNSPDQSELNDQGYLNQLDLEQQNDTNNSTPEPIKFHGPLQSKDDKCNSIRTNEVETPERQSKTKDTKKRKNTQVN